MEKDEEKKQLDLDESIFRGAENYESDDDFDDFADFSDEAPEIPEVEDISEKEEETSEEASSDKNEEVFEEQEEVTSNEEIEEQEEVEQKEEINSNEEVEEQNPNETEQKEEVEISKWEELDENNSVVKKYMFYIKKEFIPLLDRLSNKEKNDYINDAILLKITDEQIEDEENKKKRILTHIIITVLTFIIITPIALFVVNKAIMATFDNYKYSQDNFERLYKERFEKDRAYMRSIKYNKEHEKEFRKQQ